MLKVTTPEAVWGLSSVVQHLSPVSTAHHECYLRELQWAPSRGNWQFDVQCHSLPSFLTWLLSFPLFCIPRVMLSFFWFWFIRPCLWGLCVVQIWVGRPDRSSAHISDWLCYLGQVTGDLEPVVSLSSLHLRHVPHRVMGEGQKKKKRNSWKCLLKYKCIALLMFPTSPSFFVYSLLWCHA